MDKNVRIKLEQIKDQIDELLNERELQYIGTFYGEQGKYELYLFPKSTEKYCDWSKAKQYCEKMGGSLPNIGELQYFYDIDLNLKFKYDAYWSSTESNTSVTEAYSFHFFIGGASVNLRRNIYCVRPVKRCYI